MLLCDRTVAGPSDDTRGALDARDASADAGCGPGRGAHAPVKTGARGPRPKFRRIARAERRALLIAASLRCLRRYGHEGVSVRRISAEAGVSMGLINHHFRGSARLLAAAYDSLASSLIESTHRQARAGRGLTPAVRLGRFFEACFAPDVLDPGLFRVWLVFWSMVSHSAAMRGVHDRTYADNRNALERLLRALMRSPGVGRFRVRPAAIGLAALVDGLWVELSLNPDTCRPGDAVALCNDWVAALASGGFAGLALAATRRRR